MGRGLGDIQQAILDELERGELSTAELAGRVDRSQRQVLAAVRSLEARGLVVVRRGFLGRNDAGMPVHGLLVSLPHSL